MRVDEERGWAAVPVAAGVHTLGDIVRELEADGIVVGDLGLHRPTLDDVFLSLTGHGAEDDA